MTVLVELGAYLQSKSIGTVEVNIFVASRIPDSPDACVALFEYPGDPPERGFSVTGVQWESPGVQVLCRGGAGDYTSPRAKAEAAYAALVEVEAATLSGVFYQHVTPVQAPFFLKRDEKQRTYIAFNVIAKKEPS